MTPDLILFLVLALMAISSAVAMLAGRNAVYSAMFLVLNLVTVAILYLLLDAAFIAMVQVTVYAGAIMVLFLFVIMLLGVDTREALIDPLPGQRPLAIGLGGLLAAEILWVAVRGVELAAGGEDQAGALTELNQDPGNVKALAAELFSRYLLPFEATSVLLVVAIVGVMVLARRIGRVPDAGTGAESASGSNKEGAAA